MLDAYADETYYAEEYLCGRDAVIQAAFPFYARDATQRIRAAACGNIDESNVPDCVKMCCCELAELLYQSEREQCAAKSGAVASESVGGWSQTYVQQTPEAIAARYAAQIPAVIGKWLAGTGLSYSGG